MQTLVNSSSLERKSLSTCTQEQLVHVYVDEFDVICFRSSPYFLPNTCLQFAIQWKYAIISGLQIRISTIRLGAWFTWFQLYSDSNRIEV